jgi:divalent metal cation (Fe/Co/Zn/Cd) transporter
VIILKVWNLNLDAWFGLAMSIYIIINGIKLVKEASSPLIGEPPSKEFTEEICNKILSYECVLGIHDLVIHNYGPNKTFASIHVEVDAKVDVMISHDLMDVIEREVREKHGIDLTIHMDPINIDDEETINTKEKVIEIVKRIDESLTIHDFRMVKGITHTNILFDIAIPIKFKMTKQELRKYLSQEIKELDEKYILVLQIDQMYDRV